MLNIINYFLLIVIFSLSFSCKKKEDKANPVKKTVAEMNDSGFVYSDTFYTYSRKVIYREDFNDSGSWVFNSVLFPPEWCNNDRDTSQAYIGNGKLVLKPKSLDFKGKGYLGSIYAENNLPILNLKRDKPYGIEIHFSEYGHYNPTGSLQASSSFKIQLDSLVIEPPFTEDATMTLNDGSVQICFRNDTILGVMDTPNKNILDFLYLGRVYIKSYCVPSHTNGISFETNFVATGEGCEGQNCIVDYFEIYEFL